MTAKKAHTARRRQKARKDSEEAITERNPMGQSVEPSSGNASDADPVTERRPQPNPALDGRAIAGHADDDPVTRERVVEDTGGRGSD